MNAVRCAACGASQSAGGSVCTTCGSALPVARTLDDLAPIDANRGGTVPEAPLSAAVRPEHLAAVAGGPTHDLRPSPPQEEAAAPPKPAQSAQSLAAAKSLAAGTVIDGKYAIVRLLGQGGMGIVYLARDIHTGTDVVLKAVRSELSHRADVRARTLAEGRVLGQIDHPNVVHLKAVVVDATSLWLVMQYIEGESLDRTIDRYAEQKEHMPLGEALRIFHQIVSGIAAAHAEGVIHRDLKPANVLLRKKDQVAKVTDFGIAKAEHDDGTGRVQTRGVIGSIWYMSPEQVTGRRDLDKRVDIYALGVVLYQMLTGKVPFDADSDYEIMRQQAEKAMPLASEARGDLPPSVDALLQKLCAKKRDERFSTCEDVLAAVSAIEAEIATKPAGAVATQLPAPAKSAPEDDEAHRSPGKSKDVTTPPVASTRAGGDGGDGAKVTAVHGSKPSRVGLWIAGGLVLAAVGSAVTLVVTGVLPPPSEWLGEASSTARPEPSGSATAPTASATTKPTASTTAGGPTPSSTATAPVVSPFESLPGTWVGAANRSLEAVMVADTIELRVKDPAPFAPADYEAGEARFVLRRIPGEDDVFAVEDRLRPSPPEAFPYNRDRARSTCQEVRTEAGGSPLRATFDGTRLSVELMKLEPTAKNFLFEKGKTISCLGLGKLKASKVVSILTRAK